MGAMQFSSTGPPPSAPILFASPAAAPELLVVARRPEPQWVVACVNDDFSASTILDHAGAIGKALGLTLVVARVLETPNHFDSPVDPLEWQMRRRQERRRLERVASVAAVPTAEADCVLLAGSPADELSNWAAAHGGVVMALATREHTRPTRTGLGSTAHGILQRGVSSLLFVPPSSMGATPVSYRRILVPLDGSPRAESVLPVAIRIARTHGAELILAHAVTRPEIVGETALEEPAGDLRAKLEEQNERRARVYLEELRARLWNDTLPARSVVARSGDPREQLRRLVADQHADLIVLSSHGRSGLGDVACGSVAEYLAMHAVVPLLIVRPSLVEGLVKAESSAITIETPTAELAR